MEKYIMDKYVKIWKEMLYLKSNKLRFDISWDWIHKITDIICSEGYRKYFYSHEEHSRFVFTDMHIVKQTHQFGGGNIIADSGKCSNEKEAAILAIDDFLNKYDTLLN
jgi:hypothetical protein